MRKKIASIGTGNPSSVRAALTGFQVLTQARNLHTYCSWCLLTSAATFGSVPLVLPEARATLKRVLVNKPGGLGSR